MTVFQSELRKSGYLTDHKLPYLWYQVDEGDGDVPTFFYYMGLAVKKAAPHYKKTLPLLTPEYLHGISTFTLRYFEELYNRLLSCIKMKPKISHRKQKSLDNNSQSEIANPVHNKSQGTRSLYTIVLDNYHEAPAESKFHEVLKYAFSNIPEGVRVIVISRREPQPPFAMLQAKNMINFLGWDEIRMSLQETKEFVERRMALSSYSLSMINEHIMHINEDGVNVENNQRKTIPDEIIRRLYERTEGWLAGLILLFESAKTKNLYGEKIDHTVPVKYLIILHTKSLINLIGKRKTSFLKRLLFPKLPRQWPKY